MVTFKSQKIYNFTKQIVIDKIHTGITDVQAMVVILRVISIKNVIYSKGHNPWTQSHTPQNQTYNLYNPSWQNSIKNVIYSKGHNPRTQSHNPQNQTYNPSWQNLNMSILHFVQSIHM